MLQTAWAATASQQYLFSCVYCHILINITVNKTFMPVVCILWLTFCKACLFIMTVIIKPERSLFCLLFHHGYFYAENTFPIFMC